MGHLELAGLVIGEPQQGLIFEIENVLHQGIGLGHMQMAMDVHSANTKAINLNRRAPGRI